MKIVMYHYVRPLMRTRYPRIKGRTDKEFANQIHYFKKNYHIVEPDEVIYTLNENIAPPPHWVLLTFDDGLIDHYRYVFPVLLENKVKGMFFPPSAVIEKRALLDVSKIQFVLAACDDVNAVFNFLCNELQLAEYTDSQINLLKEKHYHHSRFDNEQTMFIKNVLQKGLPLEKRTNIIDKLFARFISVDPQAFAEELYMSENECKSMIQNGMHFGSHGVNHFWLGELDFEHQKRELLMSANFLNNLYGDNSFDKLTMCYPYGSYNQDTLSLLKDFNFKLGLTTKPGECDFPNQGKFELSRYDTNDFPF
jgi:peptidoglycan/xylan/chitin deacetylase (PgdA/CDA1 family)